MEIARCSDARRPRLNDVGDVSGYRLRRCLFVWLMFATAAFSSWTSASRVFGQDVFDPATVTTDDGGGSTGWGFDDWPVEVILLVLGVIFTTTLVFAVVYRLLLNRWFWPMNAYGISLFIILTCSCAWAGFLFWEDLLDRVPAPIRWVQKYGGVMVLVVGWMFASVLILLLCRSDRGRLAPR